MSALFAAVRPDGQNFPLFVHVLGATILVGGLLTAATILALARGDVRSLRLGYWTLLAVSLPGWIIMRIGAQWIYSEQGWDDLPEDFEEPAWLGIGYFAADLGGSSCSCRSWSAGSACTGCAPTRIRPPPGDDDPLAHPPRRLRRRRLGDGRQAQLVTHQGWS